MKYSLADWNGYDQYLFAVEGRESFIVCPREPAAGRPWVWRAEFFGAFDTADRALLEQGWHLAYHRASDMYGCPLAVAWMEAFYQAAVGDFGLGSKALIFGFSRGGLYAAQYALAHPEHVLGLYLDAPVLDIRSWPGGKGASRSGTAALWQDCLACYGLDEASAMTFGGNPLDRTEELAALGIPVLLVAGLADQSVPYEENGRLLKDRMLQAGGYIVTIEKEGCGHHPHSLEDPAPITAWCRHLWEAELLGQQSE